MNRKASVNVGAACLVLLLMTGCKHRNLDASSVKDDAATESVPVDVAIEPDGPGKVKASLSSDSEGAFACAAVEAAPDGERLKCTRGTTTVHVLHNNERSSLIIIRGLAGQSGTTRTFVYCDLDSSFRLGQIAASNTPWTQICHTIKPTEKVNDVFLSPFLSTVEGVSIRNAHVVGLDGQGQPAVFRGMKPLTAPEYSELQSLGIDKVVMFKTAEPADEAATEGNDLVAAGLPSGALEWMPFPWKDFAPAEYAEPCRMTIKALKIMRDTVAAHRKVFFHCTVGEDRTGYLAGLYRMVDQGWSAERAFREEMCENGYSAGNSNKPYEHVIKKIDDAVTPLFVRMSHLVATHKITKEHLDESVCNEALVTATNPNLTVNPATLNCAPSVRYFP